MSAACLLGRFAEREQVGERAFVAAQLLAQAREQAFIPTDVVRSQFGDEIGRSQAVLGEVESRQHVGELPLALVCRKWGVSEQRAPRLGRGGLEEVEFQAA